MFGDFDCRYLKSLKEGEEARSLQNGFVCFYCFGFLRFLLFLLLLTTQKKSIRAAVSGIEESI